MTNRREFLVKSAMAAGAVSFLQPLNAFAGLGRIPPVLLTTNKLTILHTSNLSGQWSGLDMNEKMYGLGGLHNVGKKIKDIRNEGVPFLAIDAGNMTGDGTQTYEDRLRFYRGMHAIGYDAVIPGHSDLIKGSTPFEQLMKESGLHVIAGKKQSFSDDGILPYYVITKGESSIGIIKVQINPVNRSEHLSLNYTATSMNKTALLLKEVNSCRLIVCIVQASRPDSLKLAELSSAVDAIVSSVDNNNSIHNTLIARNKTNQEVVLSFAGSKGTMMSRIDFTFNDEWEKIYTASNALFIGAKEEGSLAILRRYNLPHV